MGVLMEAWDKQGEAKKSNKNKIQQREKRYLSWCYLRKKSTASDAGTLFHKHFHLAKPKLFNSDLSKKILTWTQGLRSSRKYYSTRLAKSKYTEC